MNRFTQTSPKAWIQLFSATGVNVGVPSVDQSNGDVYIPWMDVFGGVYKIKKFDVNGVEDTAFFTGQGTGWTSQFEVSGIVIQANGKLVVWGGFNTFNGGAVANGLLRLNTDGTLDTAFNTNLGTGAGGGGSPGLCYSQADNKILVGGGFTTFNGSGPQRFIRLNADGTLDSTFNTNIGTGVGVNGNPQSFAELSTGTILIGNDRTTFNGVTVNRLTALNSDGTANSTYQGNMGTGFDAGTITGLCVLSDDSVIVGGNSFANFNGNARVRNVKLNPDGTENGTFYTNTGAWAGSGFPYIVRDSSDNVYMVDASVNGKAVTSNGTLIYLMSSFGVGNVAQIASYISADILYQRPDALGTYKTTTDSTISWTAPAGVTEVVITPVYSTSTSTGQGEPRAVTVVPNTTYNVTINSSSFALNSANTLGSIYTWTGGGSITIRWVE